MGMSFSAPRAATIEDIDYLIKSFAHAAAYLEAAGFDGVQLHGAHGYLIAQFLTSSTNLRTDKYGGSLANRARFLVEVAAAVRAATSPSFIVGVKLNSVEFQEGGFTPEEAKELVSLLQNDTATGAQLDFVELSGGTYEKLGHNWEKESTRRREAFFLEFAETIVPALGPADQRKLKVYLTGGLRSLGAIAQTLDLVDGVGMARPSTQDPHLADDLIEGKITGAVRPVAPFDNDSGLGFVAASAQMRQIATGEEPFNLSDTDVVAEFRKGLGF
jgi:2,4-dienoyl-CoA reductase-like NADH-dependent reductase (Old Yellow Enzyme family)